MPVIVEFWPEASSGTANSTLSRFSLRFNCKNLGQSDPVYDLPASDTRYENQTGVRKSALARFRIAAKALYGFTARPVTAVPRELTFWKGVACSGGLPDPLAPAPFRFQVNRPKKDCRMRFSRRLKVVNR